MVITEQSNLESLLKRLNYLTYGKQLTAQGSIVVIATRPQPNHIMQKALNPERRVQGTYTGVLQIEKMHEGYSVKEAPPTKACRSTWDLRLNSQEDWKMYDLEEVPFLGEMSEYRGRPHLTLALDNFKWFAEARLYTHRLDLTIADVKNQ